MAVWYSLRSFVIFFQSWYVWTKKNLATLLQSRHSIWIIELENKMRLIGLLPAECTLYVPTYKVIFFSPGDVAE
jgi:hypothetical protein